MIFTLLRQKVFTTKKRSAIMNVLVGLFDG